MALTPTTAAGQWEVSVKEEPVYRPNEWIVKDKVYSEVLRTFLISRVYKVTAHANDQKIKNHALSGIFRADPWFPSDPNSLDDELVQGFVIDYALDGTASGIVRTTEVRDAWETVKRDRPRKLEYEQVEGQA